MHNGNRRADVPDLMRDGGYKDSRAGEELMQARLLVCSEIVGDVDDHCGHACTDAGLVGREPDIGQKDFAVVPRAMALHHGAKGAAVVLGRREIEKRWEIRVNRCALERSDGHREEFVSGFIRQKKMPLCIGGKDGRRTAFEEAFKLLFGIFAGDDLRLNLTQVVAGGTPAADDCKHEEANTAEGGEGKDVTRQADSCGPLEAVEGFGKGGTDCGCNADLPSSEYAADQQHG